MSAVRPIGGYALLSNCQGAALVNLDGSIDWACMPRFDSPSIFARLLGAKAGHWRIGPSSSKTIDRAYLQDTMVLRTVFRTETGATALTDAFALSPGEEGHDIGRRAAPIIVRTIESLEGKMDLDFEVAIRPGYGLTSPVMIPHHGGLRSRGGPQICVVSSSLRLRFANGVARTSLHVREGDRHAFALETASPWEPPPAPRSRSDIQRLLDATIEGWRSWSALHQTYPGPYAEQVRQSGRVLQALTYAPSGAVVAAPTTSLPEELGGVRNWDYRYCWVRDASMTMAALWVAACPDEARKFFDFLATATGGQLSRRIPLQILYGVGAERLVPEHELEHLEGYANSRPVRIGNGAWNQTQLDVYGELLDAASLLADQVGQFDAVTAAFLVHVADEAAARWDETDQGIWEVRGAARHFVHSKLMCWVALDRAITLAARLGAEEKVSAWRSVRDDIRAAIETRGWSDQAGAFTQTFGSDDLDASNLMMPIVGFLPPDDPRIRSTVEAIAERLTDERGFLFRYRAHDGLAGEEGTFAICTYWLVQCLAMQGQIARARELFERVTNYGNDVGLLSEEIDPASGQLLGNFPQAFTHVGLVNAAWAIAQAEAVARDPRL